MQPDECRLIAQEEISTISHYREPCMRNSAGVQLCFNLYVSMYVSLECGVVCMLHAAYVTRPLPFVCIIVCVPQGEHQALLGGKLVWGLGGTYCR